MTSIKLTKKSALVLTTQFQWRYFLCKALTISKIEDLTMDNFAFIPNHLEIDNGLPFELAPGFIINKASNSQIKLIDKNIEKLGDLIAPEHILPYKISYSFNQVSNEEMYVSTDYLERIMWKYYVINYGEDCVNLSKLQLASNLSDVVLCLDVFTFEKYQGEYSFGYTPELVFRFFNDNDLTQKKLITINNLQQIQRTYKRINEIEKEYSEIFNAIILFNSLRFLSQYHNFKILGLFTVIESLLTHKPTSSETGDSITRQIRTKVPLLLNHDKNGKEILNVFEESNEQNVWKKLYAYRSCLAHGRNPDFKKELLLLENPLVVHDFLINCIKRLLLLALFEPRLVCDLKEC